MPMTNTSRAACFSVIMRLAIAVYLVSGFALSQTPDSQTGEANKSWNSTTDLQSDGANPTRTTESHTQSGNRTLDNQSVQRRDSNGQFEPYQDIERETVKVNATTVRTTTRTFGRDSDGAKTLVQVTEEEKRSLPGGDSNVIRSTSNPDANGNLQLVQREVEATRKISKNIEETKTTVMLPDINGGLSPAMQVQEHSERGANDTVESQKTTLLPDGTGNWQVSETRHDITRQDGKNRSTEERVYRPDPEGKLAEISRTISKESEIAPGEKHNTTETYSVDVPGLSRDGSLHLVERSTVAQRTSSTGQQTTQRQVEQPDPGNPDSGLQVTILTTDSVSSGASGAQATRTIQMRDPNGSIGVVSVDTTKSDKVNTVQVQVAPPEKPK